MTEAPPKIKARFPILSRFAEALAPHPSDNPWLDLLRTFAILLVLARHAPRQINAGPAVSWWEKATLNGWIGVDLFFVMSGYLVTSGLFRELRANGKINIAQYATRRILRIVPAYYFVLLLVITGYFPFFPVSSENLVVRTGYHILFLQDYFPSDINIVFWSLGVEAKFYAIIPLVLLFVLSLRTWPKILAVGLAVAMTSPLIRTVLFVTEDFNDNLVFWTDLRSPFYACLEPLVFGFLIAIAHDYGFTRFSPRTGLYLLATTLFALSFLLGYHDLLAQTDWWDYTLQPLIIATLFSALLIAAINLKQVHLPLEPVFRFGARISYSLYLVHFPLGPLSILLSKNFDLGPAWSWVIYLGISLVHAIFIAVFIEYPFMKRKVPETRPF